MARLSKTLRAIAVLEPDWHPDNILAADSAYGEADPRPGTPTTTTQDARLMPQILGAQRQSLEIDVVRSGFPGIEAESAQWSYRLSTDASNASNRGWEPPIRITDWVATGDAIGVPTYSSACTFPLSGKVALHWDGAIYIWDPHTHTMGSDIAPVSVTNQTMLVCVPGTERLLIISITSGGYLNCWYTDDYGATTVQYFAFTEYATVPTATTATKCRAVFDAAGGLRIVYRDSATSNVEHFVSYNFGGSVSAVESFASTTVDWDMCDLADGSIGWAYIDSLSDLYFKRLGGAATLTSSATAVTVSTGTYIDCWVVRHYDGSIWLYGVTASGVTYFWRSDDNGDTWSTGIQRVWENGDANNYPKNWALARCGDGSVVGATLFVDNVATNEACMVRLGGWIGPHFDAGYRSQEKRLAMGGAASPAQSGSAWVAWARPQDYTSGWTAPGAGTYTMDTTRGAVLCDSTAGSLNADFQWTYAQDGYYAEACIEVVAHNLQLAKGIEIRWDDATTGLYYRVRFCIWDVNYRVRDVIAGAWMGAAVAIDGTQRTHIRFRAVGTGGSGGNCRSIVWQDGDTEAVMTDWGAPSSAATGAADTVTVNIGVVAGGVSDQVRVYYMNAKSFVLPASLSGLDVNGANSTSTYPVPIPDGADTTSGSERLALLRLAGGPGMTGDAYTHPTAPGYPVEAIYPQLEPSPDKRWRDTVAVPAIRGFAHDLRGYATHAGSTPSLLLCVRGVNMRTLVVQGATAVGGPYTTLGTMNLATGFTGLTYDLTGEVVYPKAGTAAGGRHVGEGELAGCWIALDTAGAEKRYRIRWNSGGWWAAPATIDGPRLAIYLQDYDGAAAATGLCNIVWTAGVMPVHLSTAAASMYRYFLVGWSAASSPAETYYEAGSIALYGYHAPGRHWSATGEWELIPNIRATRDAYGTERRSELGPVARVLDLGWDVGVDMSRIRDTTGGDYYGDAAGAPLTASGDVWRSLWGLWKASKGGSLPVVLLLADPGNGNTVTDPTLWVHGYLDAALRKQGVLGRAAEGSSEVDQFSGLRLREIV